MKLSQTDPKIYALIKKEIERQKSGLVLIPSENYASPAVISAMGTPLSNKYSEGYPYKRYYGGNEFIDEIETLAIERAKKLFRAEHANVQPHSGSQANAAVYLALLNYRDKILGIDLSAGGHFDSRVPGQFFGKIIQIRLLRSRSQNGESGLERSGKNGPEIQTEIDYCQYHGLFEDPRFQKFPQNRG